MKYRSALGILLSLAICVVGAGSMACNANPEVYSHEAFDAINGYRAEYGLPSLIWDSKLADLATQHSQYMSDVGKLVHSTEVEDSIKDAEALRYGYVECIAYPFGVGNGKTLAFGWMDSPPHKAALLDPLITYGAVGLVDGYATFLAK